MFRILRSFSVIGCLLSVTLMLAMECAYAQTARIDSLLKALETVREDTAKANTLREICDAYKTELNDMVKVGEYAERLSVLSERIRFKKGIAYGATFKGIWYWRKGEYDQALAQYDKALALMSESGNKRGVSTCYLNMGQVYAEKGNYQDAITYMLKGIKVKEELGEKKGMRIGYNNLGNVYSTMGNYKQGLLYYFKTLKIAEEMNDRLGESYAYDNIGTIFSHQNKLDIALIYYKKAVKIQEEIGDKVIAGSSYNSIGDIYQTKKQYHEALTYHLIDLKIKEESTDKQGLAAAYKSTGFDYLGLNNLDKALACLLKSDRLCREIGYKKGIADATGGIGKIYEEKKEYVQALTYYEQMLAISKELDFKEGIRDSYAHQASVYTKLKDFEKALDFTNLYNEVKDTLLNKDNFKQVAELNTRYETDKKEKEILLLTKDQELNAKIIKQQQMQRWGLIGGLGLLSISIASIYRRYRFKQKANVILEKQKEEIEQKNILITDSIDYAQTIQEAVLPTLQEIKALLPQSFVLYKPKATVSGDFYWVGKVADQIVCAVADCTGHGVPGAFMSLLGYNMLENAVKDQQQTRPDRILNSLHEEVKTKLAVNDSQEVKHGMDISLISIDTIHHRLEFAGAHNSLYLVREQQLIELKADKMGIGSNQANNGSFSLQQTDLRQGDMLYLFTDGFPDQIGGPRRKKFYYPPFKELLTRLALLDPEEQKSKLDLVHRDWMGDKMDQTDDILVIGIRY